MPRNAEPGVFNCGLTATFLAIHSKENKSVLNWQLEISHMNKLIFGAVCLLISFCSYAQKPPKPVNEYETLDAKALRVPSSSTGTTLEIARYIVANFATETERTRAAFIWVASNIEYDIDNMFAINFYEKPEQKIAKPLATHKGICENYAALFNDICLKMGIRSYVVEGYTKQNGFTDYIPHAWCAALVDKTWYLFDPTWGSGYISNRKFIRKINNYYFKTNPASLIKSHMPFDYLWQFLSYPVTNKEFTEGKVAQNKTKPFFAYADSIQAYDKMSHTEQLAASAERIEKNGLTNSMLFDRLQHITLDLENTRQNESVANYNGAVANYNAAINALNEFIQYRNNKFTPEKTDAEIQAMLDAVNDELKQANDKLKSIKKPDANIAPLIIQMTKGTSDVEGQLIEQQGWLKKYLAKGKSGRKSMFYKVTWMGIPLN